MGKRKYHGKRSFTKHRHADDADVLRTARARRIGVAKRCEFECRDALLALAPAADVETAPRILHVASLLPRRRFTAYCVDAVDGDHGQDAPVAAVAHRDRVAVSGRTGDPALA